MVKTTSIAVLAQFLCVKPCAVCPMCEKWSLLVLFVIIWAHPPRPSRCPTFKPPAAGVGSLSPCAAQSHRFTILPGLVLVEACPPSPRSQPRPATAPLFGAAPSLAICPPFGFPRRRRLRRPVASKGVHLRRRRLRRLGARWLVGSHAGCGGWSCSPAGVRHSCRGLSFCPMFTNVIANCKPICSRRAPVKYYGGLPPSLLYGSTRRANPRPACPLAPAGPVGVPSPRWGFGRRRPAGRASPSRQAARAGLPSTSNDNPLWGPSLAVERKPYAP